MSDETTDKKITHVDVARVTVKVIRPNGRLVYNYDLSSILESAPVKTCIAELTKREKVAAHPPTD